MSPAAIGCSVVMFRGWPSASKRSPTAFNTASGHPRADEEETVTMAPSGIRRAASAAEMTFCRAILISNAQVDGRRRTGANGFESRDRDTQCFDAVFARRGRGAAAFDGALKQADRAHVEPLVVELQRFFSGSRKEQHLAPWRL